MRELARLEAAYPYPVTPDSLTQRVAGARTGRFKRVERRVATLSLDSVSSVEDVRAFGKRVRRVIPKDAGNRRCCGD